MTDLGVKEVLQCSQARSNHAKGGNDVGVDKLLYPLGEILREQENLVWCSCDLCFPSAALGE
jgi:hypothetical protein